MPIGNRFTDFGGLTPIEKLSTSFTASEKLQDIDKFTEIAEFEPDIYDDIEKIFKKKGREVPDIFKKPPVVIFDPPPRVIIDPIFPPTKPVTPPPPPPPTAPEIDARLQQLISAIPIAHPGNIITSEYHNALRDAVRALASHIGLSVNPATEFKILTFAPTFLPTVSLAPQVATTTVLNTNRWEVTLSRAGLFVSNVAFPVTGGMAVQLPDGAAVFQMVVRGTRLGTAAPNPKEFTVTLKRAKFGKEPVEEVLISMDLREVKDGKFEERGGVKLSTEEAAGDNSIVASFKIADRRVVDNEKWMYFVTANWLNGDAAVTAARFEINSFQIICKA